MFDRATTSGFGVQTGGMRCGIAAGPAVEVGRAWAAEIYPSWPLTGVLCRCRAAATGSSECTTQPAASKRWP